MPKANPNELLRLIRNRRFLSLARREFDCDIALDGDIHIEVGCLWRLIEGGRVRLTSEDHRQQFGLPAPIDVAAEINQRIAGQIVILVVLHPGTLDLDLHLENGSILQIIPDSAGYESWIVSCPSGKFIAAGGGELHFWNEPDTPAQQK